MKSRVIDLDGKLQVAENEFQTYREFLLHTLNLQGYPAAQVIMVSDIVNKLIKADKSVVLEEAEYALLHSLIFQGNIKFSISCAPLLKNIANAPDNKP